MPLPILASFDGAWAGRSSCSDFFCYSMESSSAAILSVAKFEKVSETA